MQSFLTDVMYLWNIHPKVPSEGTMYHSRSGKVGRLRQFKFSLRKYGLDSTVYVVFAWKVVGSCFGSGMLAFPFPYGDSVVSSTFVIRISSVDRSVFVWGRLSIVDIYAF